MLSKKVKLIIKIAIWGYLIFTCCPQVVELTSSIVKNGLMWCGSMLWEGAKESMTEDIPEFPGKDKVGKIAGWLWEKGLEYPKGEPTSSTSLKGWMSSIVDAGKVNDRPLDEEDMRILKDIVTKGGVEITRTRGVNLV